MFWTCVIVFLLKAVELTVESYRVMYLVRGKRLQTSLLAFVDVLIGLVALRMFVGMPDPASCMWVALSYAGGYSAGSYMGLYLFDKFEKKPVSRPDLAPPKIDAVYNRKG
jgi:uncharacterized protein YebE (UPF0316 family)